MSHGNRPPPDARGVAQVIFEFTRIGEQTKVCAVDAASGIEATAFGPANAARADLERLALGKLRYVMGEGRPAPEAPSAQTPPARPGKLV